MAFFFSKNLVFNDSMQFMNSGLNKLVKICQMKITQYLVEEFGSKHLEPFKQKDAYPYEYMNKIFKEKKLPARKYFFSSTKKQKIGDDGKISDGYISFKDCLTCGKFGISVT